MINKSTPAARSSDFVITRMITDRTGLLSPITITNIVFCAWSMRLTKYVTRAECFLRDFVTRDQRNIVTLTDEAVDSAKLVLFI